MRREHLSPTRMTSPRSAASIFALAVLSAACSSSRADSAAGTSEPAPAPTVAPAPPGDEELDRCAARVKEIEALPESPGTPKFTANRVAVLGRARGEPMVLVRDPKPVDPSTLDADAQRSLQSFAKERARSRVITLAKRHKADKPLLRKLLLREGYAFTDDPQDALGLAADTKLPDLFDEPTIYLQRASRIHKLARTPTAPNSPPPKDPKYTFEGGPYAGMQADLQFGDRVALTEAELATPLHRDLAGLQDEIGFDRAAITRLTERSILATLTFGDSSARAVIDAEGAVLRLACIAEDAGTRAAIAARRQATSPKRRALLAIRDAITTIVSERPRFDRPIGEKSPDKDGQMRPVWMTAYLQGRQAFGYEGGSYPVFDPQGRAWPPEVCVDFVLDTFERAAGTWFRPRGEALGKTIGRFQWVDDVRQTRGVIGFGERADKHPDLFEVRRFAGNERVPFGDRERFFRFLEGHASEIHAGDVVAIHGEKRDNRIHQHAIFVERTDPLTGFAFGLADQMSNPRRRTWEGIMAEAPKRSLLYRVRPKPSIFTAIDPGDPVAAR